jgi:phospholipase/carboxylesterase
MLQYATRLAPSALVVTPEGPAGFYRNPHRPAARGGEVAYGWVADLDREASDERNDHFLAAALEEAGHRHPLDPSRTFLLGFSQGAGVAAHFMASYPDAAAGLVGLAGGVARASRPRLARLEGKPVLWISGAEDPAYPPDYTRELLDAWAGAGVELRHLEMNVGHDVLEPGFEHVRAWLEPRLSGGRDREAPEGSSPSA